MHRQQEAEDNELHKFRYIGNKKKLKHLNRSEQICKRHTESNRLKTTIPFLTQGILGSGVEHMPTMPKVSGLIPSVGLPASNRKKLPFILMLKGIFNKFFTFNRNMTTF